LSWWYYPSKTGDAMNLCINPPQKSQFRLFQIRLAHAHKHTRTHIRTHIRTHTRIHTRIHTSTHRHTQAHTRTHVLAHANTNAMHTHLDS